MARTQVYIGQIIQSNYWNNRLSQADTKAQWQRDRFANQLDPSNLKQTWGVGELVKWTGINGSFLGYAFEVRHYVSGVPSGHRWLFSFPIWSTTPVWSGYIWGANNQAILQDYVVAHDFGVAAITTREINHTIHYNDKAANTLRCTASAGGTLAPTDPVFVQGTPSITAVVDTVNGANDIVFRMTAGRALRAGDVLEVASGPNAGQTFDVTGHSEQRFWDMGYTDHDAMTLSGPLAAPASSPYGNLPSFMPDVAGLDLFRMLLPDDKDTDNPTLPERVEFVFDDTRPFVSDIMTSGRNPLPSRVVVLGDILDNRNAADTDSNAVAQFGMQVATTTSLGVPQDYGVFARYGDHAPLLGQVGVFTVQYSNILNTENESLTNGELIRQKILLENDNEFKGALDVNVVCAIGAYRNSYYRVTQGPQGKYMTMGDYLAFPYHDEVGLPVIRYDLEPEWVRD